MNITAYKGPAVMLISSLFFAFSVLTTKIATQEVSGEEAAFTRFAFGIIVTLIFVVLGKADISSDKKSMLIARGVFGGIAILLLFIAIDKGTVTNATILNNTYPIFATIFAAYMIKEGLGWGKVIPLALAFTGIIFLVHPSMNNIRPADILGLVSGVVGGISVVIIKELRKSQNSWTVFFYLSIFGAAFSALLAFPKWVWPTSSGWLFMLSSAALATGGQLLATYGYKYCSAATGSTVSMSTALFSALLGLIFLGERLNGLEWLGVILILISSVYLVAVAGTKQTNEQANSI